MTTVEEGTTEDAQGLSVRDVDGDELERDARAADDHTSADRPANLIALAACVALVAGVCLYVLSGYVYGYSDHTLLSIKGISWADHSAFVNDWFNERAPQPHWLFDLLTYAGERTGHLPAVYFLYALSGLAFFGLGTAWLAQCWLAPGRRGLSLGVPVLMALGPTFALGTFLPFLTQALPNNLGGLMAYAAVAALITGRTRTACALALATGIVHVQHGVVLAGVLVLAALLAKGSWRSRIPLVGTAGALLLLSIVISTARGLASGNADMIEACTVASIGHCNANTWPWVVVRDGLLMVAAAAAVVAVRWRDWRTLVPAILAPAAIVTLGFFADRLDWGIFGELAQRLFVYRLGMNLALFLPWLVVLLAAGVRQTVPLALARAAAAAVVSAYWLNAIYTRLQNATSSVSTLRWCGVAIGLGLSAPMVVEAIARAARWRRPTRLAAAPVMAAVTASVLVVATVGLISAQTHPGALHMGFKDGDGNVMIGRDIEARLAPGSVLAHPPDLEWVRLFSRRAVVGNCRAAPYGGAPWYEYKARLAALGVDTTRIYECFRSGYEALDLDDIAALRDEFGATHAAFLGADPKVAAAQAAHWRLRWYSGPGTEPWYVFEIPP